MTNLNQNYAKSYNLTTLSIVNKIDLVYKLLDLIAYTCLQIASCKY